MIKFVMMILHHLSVLQEFSRVTAPGIPVLKMQLYVVLRYVQLLAIKRYVRALLVIDLDASVILANGATSVV